MATLREFIAETSQGIARNAHFAVRVNLPKVLQDQPLLSTKFKQMLLFCEAASLPGINFNTNPVRSFGESREVPYERMYSPIQLSFIVDYNLAIKMLFDTWLDKIQGTNSRLFEYHKNYSTTVDIFVYDVQNTERYVVRLYDAFPKTIHDINLSYNDRDAMRMAVGFSYKYYSTAAMDSGVQKQKIFSGLPSTYLSDFFSFQAALEKANYSFRQTIENVGTSVGRGLIMH